MEKNFQTSNVQVAFSPQVQSKPTNRSNNKRAPVRIKHYRIISQPHYFINTRYITNTKMGARKLSSVQNDEQQREIPTKTKTLKRKSLSVNFDRLVKVTTVPHINDFSEEDILLLWYTSEEYDQTRHACMEVVRRMNEPATHASCLDHPSGYLKDRVTAPHTRGLESLENSKGNMRRIRRLAATKAVLSEQNFQRAEGYDDSEFLSQIYRKISAPCQVEANLMGLHDEKEALQCYNEPVISPRSTGLSVPRKAIRLPSSGSRSRIVRPLSYY